MMSAYMPFTSLQSVCERVGCSMVEKYFVVKAVHVSLASSSHTTVNVIQAAVNSASRTVNELKNNGPPKKIGRNVKPMYTVQTHATASTAVTLLGRLRFASEKSLMIAAPTPMSGIETKACKTRRPRRKRRKKTSS